jgi:hypothetical protein
MHFAFKPTKNPIHIMQVSREEETTAVPRLPGPGSVTFETRALFCTHFDLFDFCEMIFTPLVYEDRRFLPLVFVDSKRMRSVFEALDDNQTQRVYVKRKIDIRGF